MPTAILRDDKSAPGPQATPFVHIAYVILAHARPEQLARLAAALQHPDDRVLVHVDARVPLAPFGAALGDGPERIDRVASPWGGWGLVQAALNGLRLALDGPADCVCLLSGQDYPITTRDRIVERLAAPDRPVFLEAFPLPAPGFVDGGGMDRLERLYLRPSRRWSLPNRYVPFWPRRRLPAGLAPYAGKQFWCLPRDVAVWVLDTLEARPEIERFFRRSFVPDESFFQMLILNGPHRDRVVDDDLRFIRHAAGEAHPRLLTMADFDDLRAARELFARKFDLASGAGLLDRIDAELRR